MPKATISTEMLKERAFLVSVEVRHEPGLFTPKDSLLELERLAETAGLVVIGQVSQRLNKPDATTLIGSGKVAELKELVEEQHADLVIFDEELSPRHQRELETVLGEGVRLLDRTALILDIFAQHARTSEGALQVELAQLEYRLPRLTRQWTHLARQAGGGGGRAGGVGGVGLRGPGETQLEVDRREISRRVSHLKMEIEKVRAHRARHRVQRKRTGTPVVALVGYTNAGKSTLLRALTSADVYIADQLFATLDPTTRQISLPDGQAALITDTVGFIQKLPTALVAAFRATLEEIAEADLLLHVVDSTHPNACEQAEAVEQTLGDLRMDNVQSVTVLNKIDGVVAPKVLADLRAVYPESVMISALTHAGLDALLSQIQSSLNNNMTDVELLLPHTAGQLLSAFHQHGRVRSVKHLAKGVRVSGQLPRERQADFSPYFVKPAPVGRAPVTPEDE
ncbi:MAG: GTPase HflX [Chloroflexi bacterium]|nr:GTPase HflX [Chloroflexota bacterium]